MLLPKKVKHRKWHRGRMTGKSLKGNTLHFGQFGLKATTHGWVSSRQIEAARRTLTRFIKRQGKVWIRIFPDKPITSKGIEVSMGGGKGDVTHFASVVKPGRIIFEMDGIDEETAREALRRASHKLSVKTKFVMRDN